MKYCTYLTVYSGNKLPPFYIGFSTVKKVERGYRGSVSSQEYRLIWEQELRSNPHLFKTTILTMHEDGKEARLQEISFQKSLKVLKNPLYINKNISGHSDNTGKKYSQRRPTRKYRKRRFTTRVYGPVSEETRAKQRTVKLGKKHSEETKAKMRASHKARASQEKFWEHQARGKRGRFTK